MSTRGRKRSVSYEAVIEYKQHHPDVFQSVIAKHFGLTQSTVGKILRAAGISGGYRGNRPKCKPGITDLQYQWEIILHDAGLGMDRGCKLNDQRIHYGYDPLRQEEDHSSATSDGNSDFSAIE
jgi:hypothetical protein